MKSSTPKVQDDKAPSSSLRCRFAIQKPPLLRSKCWQGQSPVERHTNANSNSLKLQGNGKGEAGKSENPLLWETVAGPNQLLSPTLKSMLFCRTCCFFCWSWPSTLVRSAVWLLWVTHPINRASQHWSHPPIQRDKKLEYLAFPDFSCSSAVWVMLWTTLASRTCQRIHKKRLKQIPSVLLYYLLTSNLAVATKVEHVDHPHHCFLMPPPKKAQNIWSSNTNCTRSQNAYIKLHSQI